MKVNIIKKELSSLRESNNDYIRKHNELQQQNVQIRQLNNVLELDKQQTYVDIFDDCIEFECN